MALALYSGVVKAGPGWARAWPKHRVYLMSRDHVRSMRERKANGLVNSRYPANTNDLSMPLALYNVL